MEKWKKKAKINLSILIFFPTIYLAMLKCIQNLKTLSLIEAVKSVERKKNGQIKGMICRRRMILSYTIQQVIPNICTKIQNPRFSSSGEIFDAKKVYTHTDQHTHTHPQTLLLKDKNYIPPIYFIY